MLMFLLSLLVQYASFVGTVAAVHDEGIFELDGNALDQGGVDGDDWEDGTAGAADDLFIPGSVEADGADTTYFKGGGSKDHLNLNNWEWSATDVAPDKDELLDVFAAVYEGADTVVYFGADKFDDSGDAQIGFWFFQDNVSLDGDGSFNGLHTVGDVLVLSDFTNGGSVDLICVYEWNPPGDDIASGVPTNTACDIGNNVTLVAAGAECDVSDPDGAFDVCAIVNADVETAPWAFENKDGDTDFGPGQFFEGGINLSQLFGGDAPCFSTFLAETRSSQEVEAQLKDFALGSLDTCVPPDLATQSSVAEADFGDDVTDTATLSGSHGPVEGKIKFFICEPDEVTAAGCAEGDGTQVGSAVDIENDEAESAAYTVGLTEDAVGTYCWGAEYVPSDDSEYLATYHTDATAECFEVAPATIDVEKTADAAEVDAGSQIGFTVTISNDGDNTALGVSLDDPLPGGPGIDWSIESQSGGFSISGSPQTESLEFGPTSLAAGASATVHIVSNTTALSCGEYDNTAEVTTTNDGSDEASASTKVNCAEIDVEKTADAPSVNAGEQIGFTVTISNDGEGLATGLAFTDALPGGDGISWSIESQSGGFSITGTAPNQSLTFAPTTLAAGASAWVHIVSGTTGDSCGVYDNTASVTTGNDGEDEASASTEVLCAAIDVAKEADAPSVNAGEEIGFTVTISNNGEGDATGLAFTDDLPGGAGIDWSIESQSGGFSITGTAPNQSLAFAPTTLAAGASAWVHIVSDTTGDSCGQYDNTASVTTGNDGEDEASASTDVLCADIDVEKDADAASVNAGDQIGFTVTLSNTGEGDATGLAFTDDLPGGDGVSWSIESGDAGWSITGSPPNQQLAYAPTTLAAGASVTVHIVSATTAESCKVYDNTASVTTGNDGSDEDSASTEVLCGQINVEKVADDATVNAGEQIGFTVTLTNSGLGLITGLAFTDNLPGGPGISWSIESSDAGWSITGSAPDQQLVYAPTTLGAGVTTSVHIVSDTTGASCGEYDNTASVTTGNDGSDEASDTTEVLCAEIDVEKTADADAVEAGEQIGFTVTISNDGDGLATGLAFTDALPGGPGVSWSIASSDAGWSITGSAPNQSLVYAPTTLAAHTSTSVHVVSDTTADSCGQYDNTASVTTTNDGSDEASDSTFVECPVLAIEKSVAESGFDAIGQVLHYTIVVTNVGNVTLENVVVTDPLVSDLDCEPGLPVPSLAVGASFTCTASYTIVEADFDTLVVTNVACADDGMGDGEVGADPVCDDVQTPGQELQEETDAPTLPPTDGISGSKNSAPGNGAWLLVLGLAIALSTIVFMTPARKRSQR
jgi:uncharacterized repeat protein (TIGR01451 family)